MAFRCRFRIRDKKTHRTWVAHWPIEHGIFLCANTGTKVTITARSGYSEYNDRGEPVLDSWIEPMQYVRYGRYPYIEYPMLFDELKRGIDGPFTLALLAGKDSPSVQ